MFLNVWSQRRSIHWSRFFNYPRSEATLSTLIREVGADEIDLARIHCKAAGVVALPNLLHSLFYAPVIFEFKYVDVIRGHDFYIRPSPVTMVFRVVWGSGKGAQ